MVSECRGEGRGLIHAWELTPPHTADGPMLPVLLGRMETPLGVVLGDAAYAGRRNVTYVAEHGGEAYFPPEVRVDGEDEGPPDVEAEDPSLPSPSGGLPRDVPVPGERGGRGVGDQPAPGPVPPGAVRGDAATGGGGAVGPEKRLFTGPRAGRSEDSVNYGSSPPGAAIPYTVGRHHAVAATYGRRTFSPQGGDDGPTRPRSSFGRLPIRCGLG